jgi:hypothetical protein
MNVYCEKINVFNKLDGWDELQHFTITLHDDKRVKFFRGEIRKCFTMCCMLCIIKRQSKERRVLINDNLPKGKMKYNILDVDVNYAICRRRYVALLR